MKDLITFEPPDRVVVTFRGQIESDEIDGLFDTWSTYETVDNKYKLLVDCNELEEISPKVREIMRKRTRDFHLTKMAAFGASTKIRILAGLIVKMIPNIDASKFVKTEEEARAWLAEEKWEEK